MEKLLTVSVAAYNMEKYLRQTLESLALPEAVDRMEVFVVDDGGSDGSLDIAREFEARHPQCFHAVHKENGGYGTTINWSLAHATGRYFRPLDGDDWFDRDGLLRLLDILETAEADAIYTPHLRMYFNGGDEQSSELTGASFHANSISEIRDTRELMMHRLTFRTEVLRAAKLELPARILYTDSIYACVPLCAARSLLSLDFPLYCHRIGRDEQSINYSVRMRHLNDCAQVSLSLARFYRDQRAARGINVAQIKNFAAYLNRGTLRLLLIAGADREYLPRLRNYDAAIRELSPEIYANAARVGKFGRVVAFMRRTNYRFARPLRPLIVRLMKNHP